MFAFTKQKNCTCVPHPVQKLKQSQVIAKAKMSNFILTVVYIWSITGDENSNCTWNFIIQGHWELALETNSCNWLSPQVSEANHKTWQFLINSYVGYLFSVGSFTFFSNLEIIYILTVQSLDPNKKFVGMRDIMSWKVYNLDGDNKKHFQLRWDFLNFLQTVHSFAACIWNEPLSTPQPWYSTDIFPTEIDKKELLLCSHTSFRVVPLPGHRTLWHLLEIQMLRPGITYLSSLHSSWHKCQLNKWINL